jgi:hypothetical protein
LFDPNSFKPGIDALQTILELVDNLIQSVGGGGPILTGLFGAGTQLFSKQIASGIGNFLDNKKRDDIARQSQLINQQYLQQLTQSSLSQNSVAASLVNSSAGQNVGGMLKADQEEYNRLVSNSVELDNAVAEAKENTLSILKEQLKTQSDLSALREGDVTIDGDTGELN